MKKRVLSLMLATVMCMALAVTANAVEYDSSVLSVEQTSLINGNFPKNVRGETYGTALMAEVVGEMPDLQAAIGTNDQEGYVRTSDLSHPKFETPQDALAAIKGGVDIKELNIGSMAHSVGKVAVSKVLSLDEKDIETFEELKKLGVKFDVRKVPSDSQDNMDEILKKAKAELAK